MRARIFLCLIIGWLMLVMAIGPGPVEAAAATYYVSSSGGSDGNNGLSTNAPFATIGKVNGLNLQPGDQVLFMCGDTWRGEQLVVSRSGTAGAPIKFSSYPAGCANKPVISGSKPIGGWVLDAGSVYWADLRVGPFPTGDQPVIPRRCAADTGTLAEPGRGRRGVCLHRGAHQWGQPDHGQPIAAVQLERGGGAHQEYPLVDDRPGGDEHERAHIDVQHRAELPGLGLGDLRRLGLLPQ